MTHLPLGETSGSPLGNLFFEFLEYRRLRSLLSDVPL